MIKVLIVEDEDLIRKGLAYAFDWLKYDCVIVGEATNGQQGIERIKECQPDIVITDIRMPIMDGLEMIKYFRDRKFEVVIVSGYAEFEYAKKAIEYNVSEYLLKPIDHSKLEETVQLLVEQINKKKIIQHIQERMKKIEEFQLMDMEIYVSANKHIHKETNEIIAYIKENYYKKISLDQLAEGIEISTSKAKAIFKEDTGHTFNDFLNKYRIQMALKLINESSLKIYEIADEVGFAEYKYFSKVFKSYTGFSPSEFLNQKVILHTLNQ